MHREHEGRPLSHFFLARVHFSHARLARAGGAPVDEPGDEAWDCMVESRDGVVRWEDEWVLRALKEGENDMSRAERTNICCYELDVRSGGRAGV